MRPHHPFIPRRELSKIILKSLLLTAIAFPTLLTISNHKTNGIVADALWGEASKSRPMFLTESNIPHAPILAVLGGGLDESTADINRFQKRRERAAAIGIVELDMSDKVLLLDGLKPDGINVNISRFFFMEQVNSLSQGNYDMPETNIMVETKSTSTATNLDALKEYMKENNIDTAIIVTDEFHRIRTEALLKIKKINARVITVEQLIRMHNPHEMIGILRQNASKNEEWKISERLKLFTMFLDPKGEKTAQVERFFLGIP